MSIFFRVFGFRLDYLFVILYSVVETPELQDIVRRERSARLEIMSDLRHQKYEVRRERNQSSPYLVMADFLLLKSHEYSEFTVIPCPNPRAILKQRKFKSNPNMVKSLKSKSIFISMLVHKLTAIPHCRLYLSLWKPGTPEAEY